MNDKLPLIKAHEHIPIFCEYTSNFESHTLWDAKQGEMAILRIRDSKDGIAKDPDQVQAL